MLPSDFTRSTEDDDDQFINSEKTFISDAQKKKEKRRCLFYHIVTHYSFAHLFFPIDLSGLYRRHVIWSKRGEDDLLSYVTARFATTTTFCALFLTADISVAFSPSAPVEAVRNSLVNNDVYAVEYWAGIVLFVSIVFSIGAVLANFSGYGIFSAVSRENAAVILRSNIGLRASNLPNMLATISVYLFLLWNVLLWMVFIPLIPACCIVSISVILFLYISSTMSTIGSIIMSTSAMSSDRILKEESENVLDPKQLNSILLYETEVAQAAQIPVQDQYRIKRYSTLLQSQNLNSKSEWKSIRNSIRYRNLMVNGNNYRNGNNLPSQSSTKDIQHKMEEGRLYPNNAYHNRRVSA